MFMVRDYRRRPEGLRRRRDNPAMSSALKLLAFDTSTEHLSVAVAHGEQVLTHVGAGGAQASATLIPVIQGLLHQAGLTLRALDALVFGRGPGAFTGLRTACSVAQGLALGAGLRVLPIDTLLAVAEEARFRHGARRVVATLDARMDEVYSATYDFDAVPMAELAARTMARLGPPESVELPLGWDLAGTAIAAYGERLAAGQPGVAAARRLEALPTATALLRIAPTLHAAGLAVDPDQAIPLYVRDKVAQTTAERAQRPVAA
jgi:tRNA threonylcarbamoyladenosine biosynthesis protein TsaB